MIPHFDLDAVQFDQTTKTVVVIAQDAVSGRILMVANADKEALERTIETGEMHYRSRSRGLWRKGATSGNVQRVVSLTPDCDGDTVLARVLMDGPACHTGADSCFNDSSGGPNVFWALSRVIEQRARAIEVEKVEAVRGAAPSYTRELLLDRNRRLKKIGEEAAELISACADGDGARATEEAADLIYHIAVAVNAVGSSLDAVGAVLFERSRKHAAALE
ncbi:MAG: phosphoribosyl-ATP diphosphatase [Gemmatimonadaceae bacterium]